LCERQEEIEMKRNIMLVPLLWAFACGGSSSSNAVTQDEYDDVAQAVGSTAAPGGGGGEVGSMSDSAALAAGNMPAGFAVNVSGHVTGTHLGLSFDYQLTCSNLTGQLLTVCDPTTDRAEVSLAWSGMLDSTNVQASIERTGDWTLTGLQSGTPTFNGQGTFTFDIAVQSIFRTASATYHLDYAADYNAIGINAQHQPVSGTITYSIAAEHMVTSGGSTSTRTFDLDAVVTFHSNGTATIVLDATHSYNLNVSTGAVVRS
jgi:hypothetical protein